ncbi:MAG: TetR/AcrR family transcriptional regulator [Chloroflexota bacterium]
MSNYSTRSRPQQARSQERVKLILDTAANLFATIGYTATTTNAVAEQAGISIGSLYRYFPDKDAILHALAEDYRREEQEIFARVATEDVIYLPLPVLLDRLLDPFLEMCAARPVYAHILLGADVSPEIAAAARVMETQMLEKVVEILLRVAPHLDQQQALLTAVLCKASIKTLIALRHTAQDQPYCQTMAAADDAFCEKLTVEVKRMLLAYLREALATGA